MSFHHPEWLALLLIPALWLLWQIRRTGLRMAIPADHSGEVHHLPAHCLARATECLPALLLAVALLFLAGPRKTAPPKNQKILNNIVFLVDVSGSMEFPIPGGKTRYDSAMQAVSRFCDYREGDAFGLTIFGIDHLHWFPPTRDLSAMKNALQLIRPKRLPIWFAGTKIATALEDTVTRFRTLPEGERICILVTDGESDDFDGVREREVAAALEETRVKVFTVLIGTDAQPSMYEITARTGGKVFRADDQSALGTVFQEIDRLQKARYQEVLNDWVDWYRPVAFAGLVVLGMFGVAQFGLRFTPW